MSGLEINWELCRIWWPVVIAAAMSLWLWGVFFGDGIIAEIELKGPVQRKTGWFSPPVWVEVPSPEKSKRAAKFALFWFLLGLAIAYWLPRYLSVSPSAQGAARILGFVLAIVFGASRLTMFYLGSLGYAVGLLATAKLVDAQLADPSVALASAEPVRLLVIVCVFWSCYAFARFVFFGMHVAGPSTTMVYRSVTQLATAIFTGVMLLLDLVDKIASLADKLHKWFAH